MDRPLFYAFAVIVASFLPIYVLSGPSGTLFKPMADTMIFALVGALVVTLVLLPVLCAYFMRNGVRERRNAASSPSSRRTARASTPASRTPGGRPVVATALLAGSLLLLPFIGGEFMPHLDEGALWVRATMPYTISFDESAKVTPRIRDILRSFPEVTTVASELGRPDDGTDSTGFFNVEFYVALKPYSQWSGRYRTKAELTAAIDQKLQAFPGIIFNYTQPAEDAVDEAESGLKSALAVKVFGSDLDTLQRKGTAIKQILEKVRGIHDVTLVKELGQPSLSIKINRAAIARYGLNVDDINALISTAIGGHGGHAGRAAGEAVRPPGPPRSPVPRHARGDRQHPGRDARRTADPAQGVRRHPGDQRRLVHLPPTQLALHRRAVLGRRARPGRRGGRRDRSRSNKKVERCRRATGWTGAANTRNTPRRGRSSTSSCR